jgi:hypothetical protein
MPWGQICGSITFSNSEEDSEILNDEYTSGLLDFNFSQEEIDITKGRRYSCNFSASVSGNNLEICKWTFFGILDLHSNIKTMLPLCINIIIYRIISLSFYILNVLVFSVTHFINPIQVSFFVAFHSLICNFDIFNF